MVIWFSLLLTILGALTYAFSNNSKVMEIGRIGFFCGLLVFCFQVAGHTFSFR